MQVELRPLYNITVTVDQVPLENACREPIDDPFIHTTVLLDWRDLLKALVRWRGITVGVHVSGNQDAYQHVKNVRPVEGTSALA